MTRYGQFNFGSHLFPGNKVVFVEEIKLQLYDSTQAFAFNLVSKHTIFTIQMKMGTMSLFDNSLLPRRQNIGENTIQLRARVSIILRFILIFNMLLSNLGVIDLGNFFE